MVTSDCYDGFCTAVYSCGVPHNALVLLEKRQYCLLLFTCQRTVYIVCTLFRNDAYLGFEPRTPVYHYTAVTTEGQGKFLRNELT